MHAPTTRLLLHLGSKFTVGCKNNFVKVIFWLVTMSKWQHCWTECPLYLLWKLKVMGQVWWCQIQAIQFWWVHLCRSEMNTWWEYSELCRGPDTPLCPPLHSAREDQFEQIYLGIVGPSRSSRPLQITNDVTSLWDYKKDVGWNFKMCSES